MQTPGYRLSTMRAGLLVAAMIFAPACSAPVGQAAFPIVGGKRDTGDPSVMFLGKFGSNGLAGGCTTFVVAEHVAVAAAHCFDGLLDGQTFKIFPGSDASMLATQNGPGWIDVVEWMVAPEYQPTGHGAAADIAMLATSDPLPAPPIPLTGMLDDSIVGKTIRLVGYGLTNPDDGKSSLVKHEVANTVTALYPDWVATDERDGYCLGDSGGPELLTEGDHEVAVAIMDRRARGVDGGLCEGNSRAVRIDLWRASVIDPFIAAHPGPMAQPDMGPSTPAQEEGCAIAGTAPRPLAVGLFLSLLLLSGVARLCSRRPARADGTRPASRR